ncbi:hypothetical protein COB11_07120 [Candidatus Aerophobetes bacterium]|uniref:Uncharacterized protein n=1 Tax=Aerophobetes bacterium TaxID=2030807 RepID=A0A2A4YCX7_UNCAE|nr:MAG: hypothetical protein COB11_07120 [Candidatus Aerophobetes bacterium]
MDFEALINTSQAIYFPEKDDIVVNDDKQDFPTVHKNESGFFSSLFRDYFFTPLHDVYLHGGPGPMAHQKSIYRRFWFEENQNCVYYGQVEEIKKQFDVYNQKIIIKESDGSTITVSFRTYETKSSENDDRPFTNLIVYGGSISTLDNNLGGNLSEGFCHVEKYLDSFRLRILNFSVYDVTVTPPDGKPKYFKPHCLDDLGSVMGNILKALHQKFGSVDGIICHSLACIVFSKALEFLEPEQLDIIPKFVVLDRGTSSVKKATRSSLFGDLILAAAEYFGWSNQDELHICNYFNRCSKQQTLKDRDIWVISVEDDTYFKDPTLDSCTLRYLEKLGIKVKNIALKVPLDKSSIDAHHARPRNEIGPLFGNSVSDMILAQMYENQKKIDQVHE